MYTPIGPSSLAQMCLRKALDNAHLIEDVGGLPEKYLRPILGAVKTASQLRKIEINSGDIYEETAPQWQRLIARDFSALAARHNFAPSNPKSWHKVYERYKKLQDEQIAADTERMMQAFAARDQEKHSRSSTIISCQKSKQLRPGRPKTSWSAPRAPQSFLQKTREQVRLEAQRFNLRTPTGRLLVPPGQIKKAPLSKLEEARIARQPGVLEAPIIRRARPISAPGGDLEAREARLRQTKERVVPKTAKLLTFSDDEDDADAHGRSIDAGKEQDADLDDLFGDADGGEDDIFGDEDTKAPVTTVPLPPKAAPHTSPPAQAQPAKRPRADDEAAPEQAVKRRRSAEDNTAATATSPPRVPSTIPVPAVTKPASKPSRTKGLGLSASPGANSVLRPIPRARPTVNTTSPAKTPTTPTARTQVSPSTSSGAPRSKPPASETTSKASSHKDAAAGSRKEANATETDKTAAPPRGVLKRPGGAGPSILRPNVWPTKSRK